MEKRKIALIGCGAVGNSFIYSAINQGLAQNYVLIDQYQAIAEGNALDFADAALALEQSFITIKAGDYDDLTDADILVVAAGRAQQPGETRLQMVIDNAKIIKEIALKVKKSGFNGITIVAANPVDIMTTIFQKVTNFDFHKVIGSGTILDTLRLKHLISKKLKINPSAVSGFVLGEHGDSAMIPWSTVSIANKTIEQQIKQGNLSKADLVQFEKLVVNRAYQIINLKKATYYGIGSAIAMLVKAIFHSQNMVVIVGAYLNGQYQNSGFYCGVPVILNEKGWVKIIELPLKQAEQTKLNQSCQILKTTLEQTYKQLDLK